MGVRSEIRRGRSGTHRVVLVNGEGDVVAVSPGYASRVQAERQAPSVACWSAYPPALEDVAHGAPRPVLIRA
jgi:hypothetical protein